VQELTVDLVSAIMGMEDVCVELKKLVSYVNVDVLIEEIVWRMLNIDAKLETILGRSWSVLCGADAEDMEELEWEAYEDYIHEPGMTDAELAAENDVDWEEVLCGADVEDMEEHEWEAYEDYIHEPGMTDVEWAAENDVDWEEVEDRSLN
jgi:hypothetical protein